MRRVLASTIAVLTLSAVFAQAADLPRQAPPARAPAQFAPGYSWTGFYIGINGGYGWGDSDWSGFASNAEPSGGLVGGTLGYNWQSGPLVLGLETDAAWSDLRGSFTNPACPQGCETRNNWLATVRGRLGYAIDRVMPYVTGGLAVGDIELTRPGFVGASDTRAGWTVGAGLEAAIAGNWTAKVEYLYVDLGDIACTAAACGTATNADLRASVVRAGVNLRF